MLFKTRGVHVIADFYGCDNNKLSDYIGMQAILIKACEEAKFNTLDACFHDFETGSSGIVLLAESHISYHSWGEHNYISIDCYTCGDSDPTIAINYLLKHLEPKEYTMTKLIRGNLKGD